MKYNTIPKWVWNTETKNITKEEIYYQFKGFKEQDGYEGVMIVLWGNDGYMSDEYFEKYKLALECAKELDMKIIIWDENGFPSGYCGGLFEKNHPEFCAKRLDLIEFELEKDVEFDYVPSKNCQGVVLFDKDDNNIFELKHPISFKPSKENLKIMVFECVKSDGVIGINMQSRFVDYLNKDAVLRLIECTHNEYYLRFSEYFGKTICMAFYDEPSFWHVEGGRIWTDKFAEKFKLKFGFSPITLYPSLFQDIGEKSAYARNLLLGFRADLYAEEYVKTIADWCRQHKIKLTGHQDQEEIANPTSLCGDLMKVFKYQDIPGVDEIGEYGRGSKAYKIVSSAADVYGKDLVMCEVFGAMGEDMDVKILKKEILDMFAKGINFFVPHGTWYDNNPEKIIFPPELSFRSEKFSQPMAELNSYIKSIAPIMQESKHICEVGVLYPIEDLQACYKFSDDSPYTGGVEIKHSNYLDIGEELMYKHHKDFIFLHPEILDEFDLLKLKTIIVPGMKYISIKTLETLSKYIKNGGNIISWGLKPTNLIEPQETEKFKELINFVFSKETKLEDINFDINVTCKTQPKYGHFSYISKEINGKSFLFLANSSDMDLDIEITYRGVKQKISKIKSNQSEILWLKNS